MTVSNQSSAVTYLANGSVNQWTFDFPILEASWLQFKLKDPTGVLSTIPPTGYEVVGIGSPTGGYVVYPLAGPPVAPGWRVRIQRVVPLVQQVDIVNQEVFLPEVIESSADYTRFIDQQITQRLVDLENSDRWN